MIAAVTGQLEGRTANSVTINVGGVSFLVYVPTPTARECGDFGQVLTLHTHLYVREDALNLYGFLSAGERDFFEKLLSVNGVGPKVALALLSSMPLADLEQAISSGDVDRLTRIPGVGKKTSARLILDLKGKLDLSQTTAGRPVAAPLDADVVAALTHLGYPLPVAQDAVQHLQFDPSLAPGDKIRLALRYLASR